MPNPTVGVGGYGEVVARLHDQLAKQGYQVPASEVARRFFGPGTRAVLLKHQAENGIPRSGQLDAATAALLEKAASDQTAAAEPSLVQPAKPAAAASDAVAEPAATRAPEPLELAARTKALLAVLPVREHQEAVVQEVHAANGDFSAALTGLQNKLPAESLKQLSLAHSLAVWSDDHVPVVTALAKDPDVQNLRDVALRFNVEKLAAVVDPKVVPESTAGATEDEKARNFAVGLQRKLFVAEPTAVLQRMVHEAEIPIADANVRGGVASFLGNQPDFNIGTTSIHAALKHPEAFKDIAEEHRPAVVEHLKTLQRVHAISPVPEAVPALMKANLTSAFRVAEIPETTFLRAHGGTLGEETARQVHTSAVNAQIRNEHALITMREAMRGTGLAIIDGKQSREERLATLQGVADERAVQLNLETLFGGMDYCECDDCLSVYSPAAYFVELLQFLRNNDLGPDPASNDPDPAHNPNIHPGIKGTPLEKLFRRRPDLGCLELTCENTFTVLPYIDLVNEVMESFVIHLAAYHNDPNDPKQATLEAFNVEGETTGELLAQPQHINYDAYCVLKNAVYPFTLPYHQPIDATRILLKYLGTSRYELLDTYRAAHETCTTITLTPAEHQELEELHQVTLDRAVDAEFLGLTQEEYIILTKAAFWPKRYFEITQQTTFTDDQYRQNIGVKPVAEYYGYIGKGAEAEMLDTEESRALGLTFVKRQFLPRTGVQYTDLVELLTTQFINPNYPQGKALTILESIRFSYRFLQTLVDTSNPDCHAKFAKLIAFLEGMQKLLPDLEALLHPDPCKQREPDVCTEIEDPRNWVYCYFERIGKLIVLESGEGPRLPLAGNLYVEGNPPQCVGRLLSDGAITSPDGTTIIGQVGATTRTVDGVVETIASPVRLTTDKANLQEQFGESRLAIIASSDSAFLGYVFDDQLIDTLHGVREVTQWLPSRETCDLDKVRLTHLDGTALTVPEYDRIHRFVRLWRKMGWSIDETDKALIGLTASNPPLPGGDCDYVGFDAFTGDCGEAGCNADSACDNEAWNYPDTGEAGPLPQITADFLHQLVAVRKLLDLTGLPLAKLLTFWADISTAGDKSLYARLFLTHNFLAIDKVFHADANGNYLTQAAKITDHLPVLMAALRLKADDITAIMSFRELADSLTLASVSALYRHSLLAKILHVRVSDLPEVVALLGEPFNTAWNTCALLDTWGKMEDAGFTFRQLNYVIRDFNDPLRPLAPSQRTILQITKTLYDGLTAIDRNHPDLKPAEPDAATTDLVRAKAGLLFQQTAVDQIIALLEGSTVYTTNAPANQTIKIPDALARKLKYTNQKDAKPPAASIQVTGILTEDEAMQAKTLSSHLEWPKAIDRVGKQALNSFNDVLFGIFPNRDEAIHNLLAGDVNVPPDPQHPDATDANTAPAKRLYFLLSFMPFLRQRLAQRLIVDTLSGFAGLANDMTRLLLLDVLKAGTPPQSTMRALEQIKLAPAEGGGGWQGYLIPSADDDFTFVAVGDTQPAAVVIDGQPVPFTVQQEDPSNVWSTEPTTPIRLKSGKLYWLVVSDRSADQLQWKTSTSPRAPLPASALLPDYSAQGTAEAFGKLHKAAILINGFGLSVDEVSYWQNHASDFDGFDFNSLSLQHWKRLQAYTDLRNNLPKGETRLIDLFKWASQQDDATLLSKKIAAVTGWKQENVDRLLTPDHFDLNRPEDFLNEVDLVLLRKVAVVADKIAVDIDRLFEWAKPGSKFWDCHEIAEGIRNAARARFDQEDWEQVVKPLNDQLREDQKQALIAYLLVQQDLIDWGVVDADSLFEFFLIDVQMDACMQTSRIKQAISSVQLFIQRCLLGMEEKTDNYGGEVGVPNNAVDRDRWEWMQRYRVWEANRKVFCYPENWLVSELRDDKSPFFKELESELLQKDINTQTVQDALKSYLIKVDEVANLKVVGLHAEQVFNNDGTQAQDISGNLVYSKLHVFASTRNAPYFYYYRYFQIDEKNWCPWEKVQVDIPQYDVEIDGQIKFQGAYVIPVVWNNRTLIFFPQIMKKTVPSGASAGKSFQTIAEEEIDKHELTEVFEVKMAWSEYRNGKWTQKQQSALGIYPTKLVPYLNYYEFIPRILTVGDGAPAIVIDGYFNAPAVTAAVTPIGSFYFEGSQIRMSGPFVSTVQIQATNFHYEFPQFPLPGRKICSLQAVNKDQLLLFEKQPFFKTYESSATIQYDKIDAPGAGTVELDFYHPFVHDVLGKMGAGTVDDLFAYVSNYYYKTSDQNKKADVYGSYSHVSDDGKKVDGFNELKRAYSIYNWEATFHAPMLLVDRLLKANQFEQALKMCEYVLNPHAEGAPNDETRFWQFPPFKEIKAENVLQSLFLSLQPGKFDKHINEWRNKPFQPHVVARQRPSAYMKWVAMTYIKVLIAWGDYLFRQDTIETINQATQLYVLAAHIYGPRGQKIPRRGKVRPETYNSLLDKWDAFGNAMVELELAFPFSNQTPFPIGVSNGVVGLANVFGFASTLYFCIPDNPELTALRDTIDDRLFKIRHCENIQGVFRQLPLFEPPIDPGLLVQAAAQGLSLASVLNDLNSPMPNYRFYYLLQKALELCSELKALGNAFLSAKEKGDAEALSRLRATHDSSIQNLVMEVRKQQLEESQKSLEALQQSRKGPAYRLQHYLKLIGEDLAKVPDENADFGELPNQIEQPIDESGLKLIGYEKEEMDKAAAARFLQVGIGINETIASMMNMIPNFSVNAEPFGVGGSISFGGSNMGASHQATARVLQIFSNDLSYQSSNAGRKAGLLRQLQDRVQQANVAGYEIKNIDKQRLTQQIRIAIANQEITNQQQQIDNAQAVEDFLRSKYTNQELYTRIEGQIKTLYHQAYTLAYDLAKRAEKVFRFERGLPTSNFIQFGYWDPAYDGLLAGERLYIGLKQLEAAYQEKRGYDYEVSKAVSLRQINPLALIQLRETGTCEFSLPEVLFDMDQSGHYLRRIKSVALTVPCVVGPYTSLNCTLRLLEHKFRINSLATGKSDYPEKTDETDDRFSTVNVPISSIAVSTGQNDSGVFELNFRDERYLPFEGAGVVSKWRIELPADFRQFDYDTITDVVLQLRYTSVEGGDKLKRAATDSLLDYIKSVEDLSREEGLFAAFDLVHEFPNDWRKAMQPPVGATERVLTLSDLNTRLPIFTKSRPPAKIQAADVYLFAPADPAPPKFALTRGTEDLGDFGNGPDVGEKMKTFALKDLNDLPIDTWQIKINDRDTPIDKLWMVTRYVLN